MIWLKIIKRNGLIPDVVQAIYKDCNKPEEIKNEQFKNGWAL